MAMPTAAPLDTAAGEDSPRAAPPSRSEAPREPRPRRDGSRTALAICLALSALSVLLLPSVPSYDPFSWLTWGQELAHQIIAPHEHLMLQGGPSWKPLPVLFTALFGLLGSGRELDLWIVFVRWVGLFGVFVAYRTAARLAASEDARWSGPLAGVLAAVGVCLTLQWFNFMFRATSEPLTITATLLWADYHVRGRRLPAFAAGCALSLMRPEAGILLGLYGAWCLWRLPGVWRRALVCAGIIAVPAAWIIPPWLNAHRPFQSANHARDFTGNRGADLATIALQRTEHLTAIWAPAAALLLLLLAIRHRDTVVVTLTAFCVAYVGIVEVMTICGFPGLSRFMLPAAAVVCVLGGVGIARTAVLCGAALTGATTAAVGTAGAVAVAAALLVAVVPLSAASLRSLNQADRQATIAAASYASLRVAVARTGGLRGALPCTASTVAVNHTMQTSLAWILGVEDPRVRTVTYRDRSLQHTALAFFAPRNQVVGGAPHRLLGTLREQAVLRERMWSVIRVTRTGHPRINRCVGARRPSGAVLLASRRRRRGGHVARPGAYRPAHRRVRRRRRRHHVRA